MRRREPRRTPRWPNSGAGFCRLGGCVRRVVGTRWIDDGDYAGLPDDLPVPVDDGAADGLVGREVPDLALPSTTAARRTTTPPEPRLADLAGAPRRLRLSDDRHARASRCRTAGTTSPAPAAARRRAAPTVMRSRDFERLGAAVVGISAQTAGRAGRVRGARAHPVPAPQRRRPARCARRSGCRPSRSKGAPSTAASPSSPPRVGSSRSSTPSSRPTAMPARCSPGWAAAPPRRRRPMSALAETIAIQGRVLRHVLDLDLAPAVARLEGAERVWLVGTGTSEHAACLGAAMLATAGFDARASSAAGVRGRAVPRRRPLRGRRLVASGPGPGPDDALVVISHTTETAFARRVREDALAAGVRLVSITARREGLAGGDRGGAGRSARRPTPRATSPRSSPSPGSPSRSAARSGTRGRPGRAPRPGRGRRAPSRSRSRRRRAASPSSSAPARRRSPPARER